METKYYLPIESKNLAHYFGSACIKPTKYYFNRNADVQNLFGDFLILSTKMGLDNTDCALEIVLTEDEKKQLINLNDVNDIYLLSKPLPISRIKTIYFNSESQKDHTITTINLSTAFIPKSIVKVVKRMEKAKIANSNLPNACTKVDWTNKLEKYNRILGGFALMRLGGEEYMNYSETYFSTLSLFNSVIETELINSKREINRKFHDAFLGEDTLKVLYPYLYKKITQNDLFEIAAKENQKITENKITGLIDINSLDKFTYIVSVLNTYGIGDEGRKKKADSLIANKFKIDIKPDKPELISLYFGINKGYSAFSNKYKVSEKLQLVKFQLDCQLDYYTIESIYQFAINGMFPSSEFPYLDNWCPKQNEQFRKLKKNEYIILDKVIIGRKVKVGDTTWWSNILKHFFNDNQKELFRPFLEKIFDFINRDIEEDYQDIINEKDFEIEKLKKEKNQYPNLLEENRVLKENVGKLKTEITELRIRSNSFVSEVETKYEQNNIMDRKLNEYNKILKQLKTHKNITSVRKEIDDFLKSIDQNSLNF